MPNSVDPDQTAPSVWSGSTLFAPAYMSQYLEVLWYVQFFFRYTDKLEFLQKATATD